MAASSNNLSPKQRAEVQRQLARTYRAWRSRYGEPSPKEREAIVAIAFKEARKRMRSIPAAANPSLMASMVGGAAGALVANALGNPISEGEAREFEARERAYEQAREKFDPKRFKRGGGYTPADVSAIEKAAGGKGLTNEERSQLEVHRFVTDPPDKYFAYFDKALTQVRTWMGDKLGDITSRGREYRSPMGDRRVNVTVQGINGRTYTGTCFVSAGDYCRLRMVKRARLNPLVTLPAAPVIEVGPAAALPLNPARKCRCGKPLSLMATLDKTRFWWECPGGHKTQLNPQTNPLLMTVIGNPGTLNVGDRVMYSRDWLRSTGTYTGDLPRKRGVIKEIENLGGLKLAVVLWEGDAVPLWSKVNILNLRKAGAAEPNPYAGGPVVDESPRIARLRAIAASGVEQEFEGVLLDPESASVLVQVHDALPVVSRARFARLSLPRMGNVAMQAMTRRSANPLNVRESGMVMGAVDRLTAEAQNYEEGSYKRGVISGAALGMSDVVKRHGSAAFRKKADEWQYHNVYGSPQGEGGTSPNPRAVHESIVSAFFDRSPRRIGERYSTDGQALRVWGNLVAEWRPEGLYITDAGWRTRLTANVLNQILAEAFRRGRPSGQVFQKKHAWYFEPVTHPEGRRLKPIPWTGGMVVGESAVAPVSVPAANPGGCPTLCMNPMHEHKAKAHRTAYRANGAKRAPVRAATNPASRGRKVTMTLEEFARRIKATKNPKLWNDFLAKIRGYKKWSHGTLPKRVTVESVPGAPGLKGMLITYDAGKAPESTYIMPKGTKRKGAWKHPWERMPAIKHDPEAGLVIHRVGKGQVTNFYHK